jgi:hypothetical protein
VSAAGAAVAAVAGCVLLWPLIVDRSTHTLVPALCAVGAGLIVAAVTALPVRGPGLGEYVGLAASVLALVWACVASIAWGTYEIQEWNRSPAATAATVTDCRRTGTVIDPNSGSSYDQYDCVYHWTAAGRAHSQRRLATHLYPDGHRAEVNVDVSGAAHSHNLADIVFALIFAAISAGLLLFGAGATVMDIRESRHMRR